MARFSWLIGLGLCLTSSLPTFADAPPLPAESLPPYAVARLEEVRLRLGNQGAFAAYFSPDRKRFATAGDAEKMLCTWDLATGKELARCEAAKVVGAHGLAVSD